MDSPISNMSYMLRAEMETMDMRIPVGLMMFCGNLTTKFRLGFSYEDVNVVKVVANNQIATLIFSGEADEVTPSFMGRDIYNAIPHHGI